MSLKETLHYGWKARIDTRRTRVTYTETLSLPMAGYNYNGVKVKPARSVIVTTKEALVVNGFFGHKWKPSSDDPGGEYAITVAVDGTVILDMEFLMLPP